MQTTPPDSSCFSCHCTDLFSGCSPIHLYERLTTHCEETLLDFSTLASIGGIFLSIVLGPWWAAGIFAITGFASGIGSSVMHQFTVIEKLETALDEVNQTLETCQEVAQKLQEEKDSLTLSNVTLQKSNGIFKKNNEKLTQTNIQLTLQVTGLSQSAERIRKEVGQFKQENLHLNQNVKGLDTHLNHLDDQIKSSKMLCQEFTNSLTDYDKNLKQQLKKIENFLIELCTENKVYEKIKQLQALQEQTEIQVKHLHSIRLQSALELGQLKSIREALQHLKTQFDLAIQQAVSDLNSNNLELKNQVLGLSQEREKIQKLLNESIYTKK